MESYYDNNLAVTQQMKLEMMQKMQQQQLIQRLLVIEFIRFHKLEPTCFVSYSQVNADYCKRLIRRQNLDAHSGRTRRCIGCKSCSTLIPTRINKPNDS